VAGKGFELEQVLRYRTEIERIRKQEFATAKQDFERASDKLSQEEALVEDLSQEFINCQEELENIEDLRLFADFFTRKREEIKEQKEQVDHLGGVLSDRRETLLNSTKDKKVLESLKDKKAKEFRLAMEHKEQAFIDEISVQKKGKTSK
jgi:flagellar protein FliJ